MIIVNSDKWKDALRTYSYTDLDTGDDVGKCNRILCCNRKRKSKKSGVPKAKFTTPMRRIIKKMPG